MIINDTFLYNNRRKFIDLITESLIYHLQRFNKIEHR